MKSVNSLAPSDIETAAESSVETEVCNDSIDLSTKKYFSDGKKEVNGGVAKQNKDSNLSNQPEKTKDFCTEGEKKINGHLQMHSNKKKLVKIINMGQNSDCSELESKSEDESQPKTNIKPKVSVQGEIKKRGGVEPESSVQETMTEKCDIDIVEHGSSVQEEIKERGDVEQESLVWQEIKEKRDAEPESSVEQIQE